MATALLVGLTFLATAVDRNEFFSGKGNTGDKAAGWIFILALGVTIVHDLFI